MCVVGAECVSIVHVSWEYSAYSTIRGTFVKKLQEVLGNNLNSIEKTAYELGIEP